MRASGVKVVNGAALPVYKGSCKGTVGVRIPRTRRWYTHWQTGRRAIHPRPASPVLSCRSLAIEGRLVLTCYVASAYVDCCASAGILRQPILGWPPCSACKVDSECFPAGAENGSSLRVRKRGEVEMRPSAMRAGRPCTAQGVAESVRSDTATQPGTTSSGPQA